LKLLFFGSSEFSVPFLEEIYNSSHRIIKVVTAPDKKQGRGKKILPNPVKKSSMELGVDFIETEKIDDELIESISKTVFDCIAVVSSGLILPKKLLDLAPDMCINVHPSLLPKYRGPSPIISTLLSGDDKAGVSIMKMTEEVDAGDIYIQAEFGIDSDDNRDVLENKLGRVGCPLLVAALDLIEGTGLAAIPQCDKDATFTSMIRKEDLKINWKSSAAEIVNKVRAFSSKPACCCLWRKNRIKVLKAGVFEDGSTHKGSFVREEKCGTILSADKKTGILVKCGNDEIVKIEMLKAPGKNVISAVDFVNGYCVKAGEIFE
jgi:methionyl-tRNA formyltransferase